MAEPAGHQSRRNGLVGRWVVVERRNGRASELVIVTLDEVFATIPPEESASEQASCGAFSHTEFHRRRQRRAARPGLSRCWRSSSFWAACVSDLAEFKPGLPKMDGTDQVRALTDATSSLIPCLLQ